MEIESRCRIDEVVTLAYRYQLRRIDYEVVGLSKYLSDHNIITDTHVLLRTEEDQFCGTKLTVAKGVMIWWGHVSTRDSSIFAMGHLWDAPQ